MTDPDKLTEEFRFSNFYKRSKDFRASRKSHVYYSQCLVGKLPGLSHYATYRKFLKSCFRLFGEEVIDHDKLTGEGRLLTKPVMPVWCLPCVRIMVPCTRLVRYSTEDDQSFPFDCPVFTEFPCTFPPCVA